MNRLEKFSTLFLVAGLVFFLISFVTLGWLPASITSNIPEDGGLPQEIPADFQVYYKDLKQYHTALKTGRDIYIKEACWHCHSQYVRPVGSESVYYGAVSIPGEYENILNRPQLFGTRRVGPDLSREAGKRTNDWHFAHFYSPVSTTPESVMPSYRWYFDHDPKTGAPIPKEEAVALVAYIQQLGSWQLEANRSVHDMNEISMPPAIDE
jgi:cbb3-type cytochrome oxidase cytochrome c subunit